MCDPQCHRQSHEEGGPNYRAVTPVKMDLLSTIPRLSTASSGCRISTQARVRKIYGYRAGLATQKNSTAGGEGDSNTAIVNRWQVARNHEQLYLLLQRATSALLSQTRAGLRTAIHAQGYIADH